jgi:hypothetical protein
VTILIIPGLGSPAISTINSSTSGTYNFSVTQSQVIRQAMLDIGALDGLEQPTFEEYSDCSFKLNMLAKQWMGKQDFAPGMKVWSRQRAALFLGYTKYLYNLGQTGDNWAASTLGLSYPSIYNSTTLSANAISGATTVNVTSAANINSGDYIGILLGSDLYWTTVNGAPVGTAVTLASGLSAAALANAQVFNYSLKAVRPLLIIACVLRDIYYNDTPVRILTVEEYESLPTKAMPTFQSDPQGILYEPQFKVQAPNGQLYLDCGGAQDVTKHLHVTYLAPVQDLNNPGDNPDYPQQWYQPLVLELGKLIAPMFDCEWTTTLEESRQSALAMAQEADPETTTAYFEVDSSDPYGP